MIAIMTVVFTMGFQMPIHYPDMVTCNRDAQLLEQAKGEVVSATCREEKPLKNYVPPKP
jgi:hypothetical protein